MEIGVSAEFTRGINSGNNYFCLFRKLSSHPLSESSKLISILS
jgi:hypothetical protein